MGKGENVRALRCLGYLVDFAPTVCVSVLLYWLPLGWGRFAGILLLLWWLLRDISGASPGKRMFGLRVIAISGAQTTVAQRIVRNATLIAAPVLMILQLNESSVALVPVGTILFETALLLTLGRRLGDRIAGTDVVKWK